MKIFFLYLSLIILALNVMSCGGNESNSIPEKENENKPVPGKITFMDGEEPTYLSFASTGGKKQIKFFSSSAWKISTNSRWITASPNYGDKGDALVTLSAEASNEVDSREAVVQIEATDDVVKIGINQAQQDAIILSKTKYEVKDTETILELEIGHNINYNIEIDVDWIIKQETRAFEKNKLNFTIKENDLDENRTGHIIFSSKDGSIDEKVTIVQNRISPIRVIRGYLVKLYNDTDGKNWIHNDNWCSEKPLTEWYGVKLYGNAEELVINLLLNSNNLTGSVDLSNLHYVKYISLDKNKISSINISDCKRVELLNCSHNEISDLSISGCENLENLYLSQNQLRTLDLTGFSQLKNLDCSGNQITDLTLPKSGRLYSIACGSNKLSSLDISNLKGLDNISCPNNNIMTINLKGCTVLTSISCFNNKLAHVDVGTCEYLSNFVGYKNLFTVLDFSKCKKLDDLIVNENKLTSLKVPNGIRRIFCNNNMLTTLDISKCTRLSALYATTNQLRTIYVWNEFDIANPEKSISTLFLDSPRPKFILKN